jgi:hypothetical protein
LIHSWKTSVGKLTVPDASAERAVRPRGFGIWEVGQG